MEICSSIPDVEIPEVSFGRFVLDSICKYGDKIAWVDTSNGEETYSFNRVHTELVRCTNALHGEGIRRGDIVGILCPNSCQQKILVLALALCGATIVPINNFYTKDEVNRQMQIVEPRVVFTSSEQINKLGSCSKNMKIYIFGPNEKDNSYLDFLAKGSEKGIPDVDIDIHNDDLFLLCSSGTTGPPKLVQITNRGFVAGIAIGGGLEGTPSSDAVVCTNAPMFHLASIAFVASQLIYGTTHVTHSRSNLTQLLETFQQYKVTHAIMFSPMLVELFKTDVVEHFDISTLKEIMIGGSPLGSDVKMAVMKKLKLETISEVYALTEAFLVSRVRRISTKPGYVGSLVPNTRIKVVDIVTREKLNTNEHGEIMIKGPQLAKGYYKNPSATNDLFDEEGWLKTGDMGYFDEDGGLYISDRIKDVIKTEAVQVSPAEIEAVLIRHPKISDAGVVGVRDTVGHLGEVPKAFIVKKDPTLTVDDVKRFTQDKLAEYKQLRGGIVFLDEIPKGGSGKTLKRILRQMPMHT